MSFHFRRSFVRGLPLRRLFAGLASLELAVVLIVILAGVLAVATVLEARHGREFAQWHVYQSRWFIGLLALLGTNILAATAIRFPWRKCKRGFLTTHLGLLVLLAGAIQTFRGGLDGSVSLVEGEKADRMLISTQSQFTAFWPGRPDRPPVSFILRPGPSDWPEGKSLDMGEIGGVRMELLGYIRHARTRDRWVADASGGGRPALRLSLSGPGGQAVGDQWLVASQFGAEGSFGPVQVALYEAPLRSMLDDLTDPPAADAMGEQGVVSVHFGGKMQRIPVQENVGKEVALGDSGLSLTIDRYLPAARPQEGGGFDSAGDEPTNPLVELTVKVPDRDEPVRQVAFARYPLLSMDGVHGIESPVRLWYHHPAVKPAAGVQFVQFPGDGGKTVLYRRVGSGGQHRPAGRVEIGESLPVGAGFALSVLEYLPHARREVSFDSIELAPGQRSGPEAAALVRLTAGGATEEFWLKRADSEHGYHMVTTPEGGVGVVFGYERAPLGFSLELVDFKRAMNPGMMGNAAFDSRVRLIDPEQKIDRTHTISMNQPLTHGRFTFYQSGFEQLPDGSEMSTLTVSYDPGRLAKYAGSLMTCIGVFLMFYARYSPLRRLLRRSAESGRGGPSGGRPPGEAGPAIPPPKFAGRRRRRGAAHKGI